MSALPPTDRPLTAGDYVLMKRGLFYRPNAAGYTGIRDNAGIYSADDAAQHADLISGVTAIALADAPEIAPNCFEDIAREHLLKKLNDLRSTNARPATSAASEVEDLDLYDDKVQAGIAWTLRQVGEALGLTTWTEGDGSESVEGDVGAEIHTILVDAGLRDPETNEMAALASPPVSERERELEGALGLIADGWDVIESSGSMGEMTLQAPDDWEGDQTEIVVKFHGPTAQPAGERK